MGGTAPFEHRGYYGIDGSFPTASVRTQVVALGAPAAALQLWAGLRWTRGKR